MARELEPRGPFGTALYDLLKDRRRENRTRWNADDLATALKGRVAAKTIRSWLKGEAYPDIDDAMAIADVLGVECEKLWNRAANPIDLPQAGRSTSPPPGVAEREAQAKRQLPAARAARPGKPRHRRSS